MTVKIFNCTCIAALLFGMISCKKDEVPSITKKLEGNWKVISFHDAANDTVITKTIENTWMGYNNGDITVLFSLNESTNGDIAGINVTNAFEGSFLADQNGHIMISNFEFLTKQNEPEWASLFHIIENAQTFIIENDQLVIYCNNGNNRIFLERP